MVLASVLTQIIIYSKCCYLYTIILAFYMPSVSISPWCVLYFFLLYDETCVSPITSPYLCHALPFTLFACFPSVSWPYFTLYYSCSPFVKYALCFGATSTFCNSLALCTDPVKLRI